MVRLVCGIALALAGISTAHAEIDLHGAECGLHSDYSLDIKPDALVFTRRDGTPVDIVIADGNLRVDGRVVAIGAADRKRLLDIEHGVREALPEVKAIAHEAIAIAFEAVAEVSAAFAKDGDAARASAQRLARSAHELDLRIDAGDSLAGWKNGEMDRIIEQAVGTLVGEVVGNVAGQAISVALSGDEKAAAELEARADGIDKKVDRIVERRRHELEQRAKGLGPRLHLLARLGSELDVRLADGKRLDLVRMDD
jgi:hypothetical protein